MDTIIDAPTDGRADPAPRAAAARRRARWCSGLDRAARTCGAGARRTASRSPSATASARPGGSWHATMVSPDGERLRLRGTYREVVPPERLVFTHAWLDADGQPGPETVVTVELDEIAGAGRCCASPRPASPARRTATATTAAGASASSGWRRCWPPERTTQVADRAANRRRRRGAGRREVAAPHCSPAATRARSGAGPRQRRSIAHAANPPAPESDRSQPRPASPATAATARPAIRASGCRSTRRRASSNAATATSATS